MGFNEARELFSGHYLLLAYLASLGVIQLAASRASLRGLSLVGSRRVTGWLGAGLVVTGVVLYYLMPLWVAGPWGTDGPAVPDRPWSVAELDDLSAARNVNDTRGGLSGNTQAILLAAGFLTALATAGLAGALVTRRDRGPAEPRRAPSGVAALGSGTIVDAAVVTWSRFRQDRSRAGSDARSTSRGGGT